MKLKIWSACLLVCGIALFIFCVFWKIGSIGKGFISVGMFSSDMCNGRFVCPPGSGYTLGFMVDPSFTNRRSIAEVSVFHQNSLCYKTNLVIQPENIYQYWVGSELHPWCVIPVCYEYTTTNGEVCKLQADREYDVSIHVQGLNISRKSVPLWLEFSATKSIIQDSKYQIQYGRNGPY